MTNPTGRLSAALADRYRIERELAQGGMATVFLAEDLKHKRKVALTGISPQPTGNWLSAWRDVPRRTPRRCTAGCSGKQDGPAEAVAAIWKRVDAAVASALTEVECLRMLDRLGRLAALTENDVAEGRTAVYRLLESVEVVDIGRPVLRRASEPFSTPLGTLDAIHLATAITGRSTPHSGSATTRGWASGIDDSAPVRFHSMPRDRRDMSVRVVSLHSEDAADSRVGGTAAERVALVVKLSEMLWARTGRPVPTYARATIPAVVTSLGEQAAGDRPPGD